MDLYIYIYIALCVTSPPGTFISQRGSPRPLILVSAPRPSLLITLKYHDQNSGNSTGALEL